MCRYKTPDEGVAVLARSRNSLRDGSLRLVRLAWGIGLAVAQA